MNLFHEAKSVLDKDGKVNPLGPYGRQKLTGREVSTYFRRNPVKDAQIKKAVEVALDLQGAMTVANKEIRKFYGDKILKSKEVQTALKYANEESEYHDIREDLGEGSFYGRDDLVKKWATPKSQRHLYIKLRKTDSKGTSQVSMKRKGNEDKIRKYKADGYKEVPVESVAEGKGTDLFKKYNSIINRLSDKEKDEVIELLYQMNSQSGRQYKQAFGKVKELLNLSHTPEGSNIQEARSTISTPMYKVLSKMGIQQLMKKHDAYINKGETDKNHTTISTPSGGFHKDLTNLIKKNKNKIRKLLPEQPEYQGMSLQEVTDKEIMAMRKVSKDMQNVLKSYQKIATMGDKELKNTKHNYDYKQVLQARDTIVSMIGKLQTRQTIEKSMKKESYGIADTYRVMNDHDNDEFLKEGKVLKFTNIKDKTLEKHLKVVTKKVGAKLDKISGGFAVSDTDMRGFTAVVDYIFDKSIKKNMLDGGGMSDVTMSNESNNQMWEDAIEENIERGIMRKMRKGRVAKGMPR